MKAAIYLRVSKDRCKCGHIPGSHSAACSRCACTRYEPEQDESNQEPECLRVCEARGWPSPEVIRDRQSGAKARPQWRGLLERVRRGEVGAVVVWAIDRIGRNKVQSAHDLRELARFGARVVSVQDAWVDQPEGPMRTLMVDIVTWMSEGERARLIERTKAGLARAVAAGRKLGRRAIPDGDIEAIRLLWEKGWGAYRIARDICLKESTVRTYCRRFEASKAKANAVAR